MTEFNRDFPLDCLTDTALRENSWFTHLLSLWMPAGDALNSRSELSGDVLVRDRVKGKDAIRHLRAAFRGDYMNFYCGGQSIAKVASVRSGLQAMIHEKYVYGIESAGKKYAKLTSKGIREHGGGQLEPYGDDHLKKWIENANKKVGAEKRSVDLIVSHNPNVIDLEMGLPAYSKIPEERRAPRIDVVALEPSGDGWRAVLWEVKLVGDGRARCRGTELPEVVKQLQKYSNWLSDCDRAKRVANAYRRNCSLLVGLQKIAKSAGANIQDLGCGIQAVGANGAALLSVDPKPRLIIVYDKADKSFEDEKHLAKLTNAGWDVKTVKSLRDLALSGQS